MVRPLGNQGWASRTSECKQRSIAPHFLQADFWPGTIPCLAHDHLYVVIESANLALAERYDAL